MGALVLVAMATVERDLVKRLDAELPTDAPTAFLIDIQPSQWEAVRAEIDRAGATSVDSVPVVMARLSASTAGRCASWSRRPAAAHATATGPAAAASRSARTIATTTASARAAAAGR